VRLGVSPNVLTVLGMLLTLGAAWQLAAGADQTWDQVRPPAPFWAGLWLFGACAMDMLDGAVARVGNLKTAFGGILDSTMDRVSDIAIFGAIAIAFGRVENVTFQVLALLAMTNAVLISYIKARAEKELDDCSVGFWQRGERLVAVMLGCFLGHVATMVLILAVLPWTSVAGRLALCYRKLEGAKRQPNGGASGKAEMSLALKRRTWPHTLFAAAVAVTIIAVRIRPFNLSDLIR